LQLAFLIFLTYNILHEKSKKQVHINGIPDIDFFGQQLGGMDHAGNRDHFGL
jgi:hypothetical protein